MATHGAAPGKLPPSAQPYLNWAIENERAFLRSGKWLPLLVEFVAPTTLGTFLRKFQIWPNRAGTRIPTLFRRGLLPDDFRFCVILVREDAARIATESDFWRENILRCDMGPPVTLSARDDDEEPEEEPREESSEEAVEAEERRIVVAVIDEGIAFAHPRFRFLPSEGAAARTRVEFVWVQDASGVISPSMPGKEIKAADIDAAVQQARADGRAEDGVYRDLGILDMRVDGYKPLAHRQTHGTHVLDMASGYEIGDAPATRPIIAVEMPEISVGDPAGSTLRIHAAWGLVYILWRARTLRRQGETLPVVVNLSYGPHDGPHDGSSIFELFVDVITTLSGLSSTPMQLVLAAGNYRQSRVHAHFELSNLSNGPQELQWRLQPCGLTPSFMEIYFPKGEDIIVTLTPPDGSQVLAIDKTTPTNTPVRAPAAPGMPTPYMMEYVNTGYTLDCIVLSVSPTAQDPWANAHPVVAAGIWKVEVAVDSSDPVKFDAWIIRSDTPRGRRAKGRQSYFDDCAYQRFDPNSRPTEYDDQSSSYVRRRNTLSGIATGGATYVIGAYRRAPDHIDQMPAFYSSEAGADPYPGRSIPGVNWLAPGDDARACPGVLGAGMCSGTRVAMSGTSMAAPQAARLYADTWKRTGTRPPPVPQPPPPVLDPTSNRVPFGDRLLVAGKGLMRLNPPTGKRWRERR